MSHGYSGTPLLKKLGIKPNFKICALFTPTHYRELLGPLPEGAIWLDEPQQDVDFFHLFAKNKAVVEEYLPLLESLVNQSGMIWVSWYKKAAKIPTDLKEQAIRDLALSMSLVDVKVCAVDAQWSGLKLVWRKELRS